MTEKEKPKFHKGDIRPIFQQVGFEVCKSEVGEGEWIQTDNKAMSEIMSALFKITEE
jgi:hypothetical protein